MQSNLFFVAGSKALSGHWAWARTGVRTRTRTATMTGTGLGAGKATATRASTRTRATRPGTGTRPGAGTWTEKRTRTGNKLTRRACQAADTEARGQQKSKFQSMSKLNCAEGAHSHEHQGTYSPQ
jgi:hypothetical protein